MTYYLFVGGMPEAVVRWVEGRQSSAVREVHLDLWQALAEDIQKYRTAVAVNELEAAFDNLRHHCRRRNASPRSPPLLGQRVRQSQRRDYLLPGHGFPLPVEVKAGASGTLKSLHLFLKRAGLAFVVRLHAGPLADERHQVKVEDGSLNYRLLSLPLYLAEELETLVKTNASGSAIERAHPLID